MDVRNSMKFFISSGNVYCQCHLDKRKNELEKRKKKEELAKKGMIDQYSERKRETIDGGHPP